MAGVVANRNYNIGDVIYREDVFAKVLCRSFKDIACESCEIRQITVKACKQCLSVKYCGKECQRKDWKFHKLECKNMSRLPEDHPVVDIVRLLGNVILQMKGRDWKHIKKPVFGKDFSFADINSYSEDILEDPRRKLFVKEVEELVGNFIGVGNMPSEEDFLEIFGKVEVNILGNRSLYFFIGLSKFDKVCIANSNTSVGEHRMKAWAIKKIKKGTEKISVPCVANTGLNRTTPQREFTCRCTDCSLPYGESVLTKILDKKKAFSVITQTETLLRVAEFFPGICSTPRFREQVDITLRRQVNVLGSTNNLRLKLLSLKCFEVGGHPFFIIPALMELEKVMRSVFGEYFFELEWVYEKLGMANFHLGEALMGVHYMNKASQLQSYATL